MDLTKLTVPVTTLVSLVVGLWFIFQQYTALNETLHDLRDTHDRFEYEVRIIVADDRMQELEDRGTLTAKEQREYDRLKKAVMRYEEERDKLL